MFGKLRPVGSYVPLPDTGFDFLPWYENYHTEYCASGTDALAIGIGIAASRKPEINQPEVIIPGYGCPDIVSAIMSQGGKPVLLDVRPGTPFLNEDLVRASITDATVAIVAVGFLGVPDNLEVLSNICHANDLMLIEDSAQCFPPASFENLLADLVVVSFGRGKPINLMGGGALLCHYRVLEESWGTIRRYPSRQLEINILWHVKRQLFNLLIKRSFYAVVEKLPFLRLGQTKFRRHTSTTRLNIPDELVCSGVREYWKRPLVHKLYDLKLKFLEDVGWTLLNWENLQPEISRTFFPRLRYGVLAPSVDIRDKSVIALNSAGIGANAFYGKALHQIDGVKNCGILKTFPEADNFASRLLTLPCHEDVTSSDLDIIVNELNRLSVV